MSKKLSKRQFRIEVFKGVFQSDFYDDVQKKQQLDDLYNEELKLDEVTFTEEEREAISSKCKNILDNIADIDASIEKVLDKWTINRIGKVELAILRVSVYEIKYDKIDAAIAINEAVEISKIYGGAKSGSFVNGVLAKLVD
ncbi:MAG TPA: transcription antitermination factor NusB [Lachnospiraceae bacterium]|nr:transcription antitermination factor NusB [Lachnospiraceae bacterium]